MAKLLYCFPSLALRGLTSVNTWWQKFKRISTLTKKLNTKKTLNDFKVSEPELTINFKIKKFSKDGEEIINYDCSDILKRMNVDISTLTIE